MVLTDFFDNSDNSVVTNCDVHMIQALVNLYDNNIIAILMDKNNMHYCAQMECIVVN